MKTIEKIERKIISVDAADKPLGRLAVEVAVLLRGKNKPTYVPYKDVGDTVLVKNIDKMKFTGNKLENKNYFHYTGYLGNLKKKTLKASWERWGLSWNKIKNNLSDYFI